MIRFQVALILALITVGSQAHAGPFDSHLDAGVDPSSIAAWATTVVDYSPTSEVDLGSFGNSSESLGAADGGIVSLGDLADPSGGGEGPGSITLRFQATIIDGPGADFAVFENAFDFTFDPNANPDIVFAELAFVEVSTNGSDFARFSSTSLNIEPDPNNPDPDKDLFVPFGRDFAGVNTTNINNLAGVNLTSTGTPFDLSELAGDSLVTGGLVDLNDIRFVRLVDIPGDGSVSDSFGNPVFDTWHTTASGGLDLDAIGAINKVPEPGTWAISLGIMLFVARHRKRVLVRRVNNSSFQPSK